MILTDRVIKELVRSGRLVIKPFDERMVHGSGVDLRLGRRFCKILEASDPVDVRSGADLSSLYECIDGSDGFVVRPGERVLAETLEWIELPEDVVGLVNLKSTLARLGLYIPPTVVDAGFKGRLTIELIGGTFPVKLYPGTPFLNLILVKAAAPAEKPYSGRYQGQTGVTLPKLPL